MSLKKQYTETIAPSLMKEFGYAHALSAPRLVKVVAHVGVGKLAKEPKMIETVVSTLARITGQKPSPAIAKKSIANFKVRAGMTIGYKVTLRGARMYDFFEKFVRVALPRVRDFRGIPLSSVDAHGNLSIGLKENIVFPEIRPDEVERIHGMQITASVRVRNREEAIALFRALGVPFKAIT